jgi:diacylglycerol kinase (ATP)
VIRFVVNPRAGHGAGAAAAGRIAAAMARRGEPFDVHATAGPGDATALARAAAVEGVSTVVAVGGDGTVHEVANGLLAASGDAPAPTALGIVPAGSGNDFARTLGLPTGVDAACQRIFDGNVRRVDVGRVLALDGPDVAADGARAFVNMLGIGFTAAVTIEARAISRLEGLPLYMTALLRALLFRFRTPEAVLCLDGREMRLPVTFVELCNGQWEGGGFWTAPMASPYDGKLDVVVLRKSARSAFLAVVPAILRGTHVGSARFEITTARSIRVDFAEPAPVQADGELLARGATRVEVDVVPGALAVLV